MWNDHIYMPLILDIKFEIITSHFMYVNGDKPSAIQNGYIQLFSLMYNIDMIVFSHIST